MITGRTGRCLVYFKKMIRVQEWIDVLRVTFSFGDARTKNKMMLRCLLIFLLGVCTTLHATVFDQSIFAGLRWRLIGPFRGGRVLAVAGVRGQPQHFYFGSVDGGVWETRDSGRTWHPIFDDMPIGSIGAIAIAPSNPDVIYVGTGEADMRSDIAYGNGMYKSADGGKTWTHIGLEDSYQIGKILIDPDNPNIVFVAALGHAYGPNEQRGIFRSNDGGSTWQKILYKDADTGAIDLSFGSDAKTIYASLWQTRRPPWNVYPPSNGPGSGLYKSLDAGNTWEQITGHGFPNQSLGRIGISVAPGNPNIVYALVDAKEGGLFRSEDSGANWTRVSDDRRIRQRGWYFGGITTDPKNPNVIYACDTTMYKSTDGGKTFLPFRGSPGGDDFHVLWIDPDDSNRMISGVDQGAIITLNGGVTWSSWYNQPTGQFYHVITDNRFPYWVYGAQQDSGAAGVPSFTSSNHDGINMMQFHEITAGGENGYIAPDPLNPEIVYGGTVSKLDMSTEQTEEVDPTFAYPDIYRSTWTLPLIFSPRNPRVLYFSNQHLFSTADGGKHWTLLSPDLTREKLTVPPNLDPVTAEDSAVKGERRGVIYAIAPSPIMDHLIWIGTDDGLLWLTRDEGAHWQNVTPDTLTPWSKVGIIEASHFDADSAYAAIDRHRLDDYKPYIYRTHDGGKSWTLISNGIPDGSFVNVVREDPRRKGLLYAGTELGMYVSFDDGDQWQSLQFNLPVTSVRDINVHSDDLVIATHGRAFWILDNITSLQQMNEQIAQADAWLFHPAVAYRILPAEFTGTPLPKDEPMAENPAFGAVIDYYLKSNTASQITLDILNKDGQMVRHYSSEDRPSGIDVSKIVVTPDWSTERQALSKNAGMHRFIWDLHYPFPEVLQEEPPTDASEPKGIWAPPGEYTIRLTVSGRSFTEPLQVKRDPRVQDLNLDSIKQFEFARDVEAERVRVAKVSMEVKSLLNQVDAIRSKTSEALATQLTAFEDAVTNLTELRAGKFEYGTPVTVPAKVTSLLYLTNALRNLQQSINQTDADPTPDALKGFETQHASVQNAFKSWEEMKNEWLASLNSKLKREGISTLKPE